MLIESTVVLEFDVPTKKYRAVDNTDYQTLYGLDVTTVGSTGALILGTVFFNGAINKQKNTTSDPLINHAVSNVSAWFDLPTDSNGEVVNGSWTGNVSLHVEVTNGQTSSIAGDVLTTDGDNWLYYFLNIGDTITLTNGPSDNDVITVLAFTDQDPNVEITANSDIPQPFYDAWQIDLTHASGTFSHTYKGCNEVIPCVETAYDCNSTVTGTFTGNDATNYGTQTIVDTELKLIPPAWAKEAYNAQNSVFTGTSPLTGTATQLYEGPWTVMLASDITYTQSDGLIVSYSIAATVIADVSCDDSLCKFTKCIEKLRAQVNADIKASGSSKYTRFLLNVDTFAIQALACITDKDYFTAKLAEIDAELDASGLGCDCGCGDGGFRRVLNVPSDVYNIITTLEANYAGLPQVLFKSAIPIATETGAGDYASPLTYYRPFSDVSAIVIPKSYFDAEPNGYSKKFIEIEITTGTTTGSGSGTKMSVVNTGNDEILYEGGNYAGDVTTTRHLIILSTFTVANVTQCLVAGESFQLDNDNSVTALDSFLALNVSPTLWDLTQDLTLNFTVNEGGNEDEIVFTRFKITAFTTIS